MIDIIPVAKPRQTRSDKWNQRPCVVKYRAFCDELRLHIKDLPEAVSLKFVVPMPKSRSRKKCEKMNGTPHRQKPDIDNYIKAVLDALCDDDSHIHTVLAKKVWGWTGQIEIKELNLVHPLGLEPRIK